MVSPTADQKTATAGLKKSKFKQGEDSEHKLSLSVVRILRRITKQAISRATSQPPTLTTQLTANAANLEEEVDKRYLEDVFKLCRISISEPQIVNIERLSPFEKLRAILIKSKPKTKTLESSIQESVPIPRIQPCTIIPIYTINDDTLEIKEAAVFLHQELVLTSSLLRSRAFPNQLIHAFADAARRINESAFLRYLHQRSPLVSRNEGKESPVLLVVSWLVATNPEWLNGLITSTHEVITDEEEDPLSNQLKEILGAKTIKAMKGTFTREINTVALIRRQLTAAINEEFRRRIDLSGVLSPLPPTTSSSKANHSGEGDKRTRIQYLREGEAVDDTIDAKFEAAKVSNK